MGNVRVNVGDFVARGTRIGQVSNVYSVDTTVHLHFEILQNVEGRIVHVPPYASLVEAYKRLP